MLKNSLKKMLFFNINWKKIQIKLKQVISQKNTFLFFCTIEFWILVGISV